MEQRNKWSLLPVLTLAAGIVGMGLRWGLYQFCLDERHLLPTGHPLELLLLGITALTLVLAGAAAWKLDGSNKYWDNFAASPRAALGHALAALGVTLTALLNQPLLSSNLGILWKVLGILSGPCLLLAGYCRLKGRRPHFLTHMVPCLFLVFHIINHYQVWSGDPQLQNYVFTLFGTMALMFFSFYTAAFDVGSGRRRMHLFMGLAAVYLCLVGLPQTQYWFLYLGGACWAISDLCTLSPKPRAKKKKPAENPHEAA